MPSVPIPPRPELLVSDLAGTTVRDRGEVPGAFEDALREAAVPFDPGDVVAWRGASKHEVLGRLLARHGGSARVDEVYGRFRTLLGERLSRAEPLSLPGVRTAFRRLREAGIRVALTTGFDRHLTDQILACVDWADLIETCVCADEVPRGRPAPFMIFRAMERGGVDDVRRVAVVGDTRLDLEAAANAGAPWRIGVLTGAHDRPTLLGASPAPTHLLDSIADLPGLWRDG
jgi:phosphonatase-like hydrolase